jgi:hypothetical protein
MELEFIQKCFYSVLINKSLSANLMIITNLNAKKYRFQLPLFASGNLIVLYILLELKVSFLQMFHATLIVLLHPSGVKCFFLTDVSCDIDCTTTSFWS